ncbi:MAG: preprotein translocase subunit SecG [Planctomycetota bacterium]|jgi:preprotein translocase subunit SecG
MTVLALSADSFIMKWVAVPLFVICCLALILIILVQKGRGGGLSSAFGGGGGGGLLGSKTGDFLTWVTIVLVGVFLGLAVLLAKYYKPAPASAPGPKVSAPAEPLPPAGIGDAAGDADNGTDVNSPGE